MNDKNEKLPNLIYDFFIKSYKIFNRINLNDVKPEHKFKDWCLTVSSTITNLQKFYQILFVWNIINSIIILLLIGYMFK